MLNPITIHFNIQNDGMAVFVQVNFIIVQNCKISLEFDVLEWNVEEL